MITMIIMQMRTYLHLEYEGDRRLVVGVGWFSLKGCGKRVEQRWKPLD